MKRLSLVLVAIAVLALAVFMTLKRTGRHPDAATRPERPATPVVVPPVGKIADVAEPAAPGSPGVSPSVPADRAQALIAELRPKVDAALLASDFEAADRHVDEVLATAVLEPLEKQRLMVVKMASRGMRGDHAAMLALMDEIIAVAPDSQLSAGLRRERPQIEKIQRLGPNHPELCNTCGQLHAPGEHAAEKKDPEPQNQE